MHKLAFILLITFSSQLAKAQPEIDYYNRANVLVQYQNYDEAISLLTKAILAKPDFADAYALRGDCYYYLQEYSTASENYEKDMALKKDRSSYSLACVYALDGKIDNAFKVLESNLQSKFKVRMSHILQDKDLENLRKDSRWEALTKKQWYSDVETAINESDFKFVNNDMEGAITELNKAIALDSKNAKAYGNRGLLYIRKGEMQRALEDLNQAIRLDPQSVYYGNRGYTHNKLGNKDKSLEDYEMANQLDPTNLIYYDLGIARYVNGNKQGALDALRKHVLYYTLDEMGLYFAGIIASETDNFNEALNYLNRAIDINKQVPEIYIRRGDAHFLLKQYEQAIDDYSSAIELDSSNAYAYYLRGNAKGSLLNREGACEDWRKAQEMGYQDPNGYIRDLCK